MSKVNLGGLYLSWAVSIFLHKWTASDWQKNFSIEMVVYLLVIISFLYLYNFVHKIESTVQKFWLILGLQGLVCTFLWCESKYCLMALMEIWYLCVLNSLKLRNVEIDHFYFRSIVISIFIFLVTVLLSFIDSQAPGSFWLTGNISIVLAIMLLIKIYQWNSLVNDFSFDLSFRYYGLIVIFSYPYLKILWEHLGNMSEGFASGGMVFVGLIIFSRLVHLLQKSEIGYGSWNLEKFYEIVFYSGSMVFLSTKDKSFIFPLMLFTYLVLLLLIRSGVKFFTPERWKILYAFFACSCIVSYFLIVNMASLFTLKRELSLLMLLMMQGLYYFVFFGYQRMKCR